MSESEPTEPRRWGRYITAAAGIIAMIGGLALSSSLGDLQPDPSLLGCFLYAGGATAVLAAHAWDDIGSMPADPVGMLRWWIGR